MNRDEIIARLALPYQVADAKFTQMVQEGPPELKAIAEHLPRIRDSWRFHECFGALTGLRTAALYLDIDPSELLDFPIEAEGQKDQNSGS